MHQYSSRDRLQNQVRPVSRVLRSDASFIHAIISNRPVPASWTIAGTRPSLVYVTRASSSSVTAIGVVTGMGSNATGVRANLTNGLLAAAAVGAAGLLILPTDASSARSAPFLFVNLAALGALLVLERRHPTLQRGVVLTVAAALLVLAVAMPERRSRDLWSYAVYGRMVAEHGLNPYTHTPDDVAGDAFADRINPVWHDRICVYGPLFVGLAAGVVTVTGTSAVATRLAFQGLAALAVLLALVIIDRRKRDPAAVALVALHPAVLLYGVGGGHNDALVGLAVLGACLLALDRRPVWAGLCVAAAALIKAVAGLAVVPLALWVWRRHGRRPAVTLAAVGAGVAVAGQLTGGRAALDSLAGLRGEVSWSSLWRWWIYTRAEPGSRIDEAMRLARPMLAVTLVVVLLVVLRRQGEDHPALARRRGAGGLRDRGPVLDRVVPRVGAARTGPALARRRRPRSCSAGRPCCWWRPSGPIPPGGARAGSTPRRSPPRSRSSSQVEAGTPLVLEPGAATACTSRSRRMMYSSFRTSTS